MAIAKALGDRLDSFKIGNEVDLLKRFGKDYTAYHAAFTEYKAAVRAVLPGAVFSGPAAAWDFGWCQRFAKDEGGDIQYLTQHYYRSGAKKPEATLEYLLHCDEAWGRTLAGLRDAVKDTQGGFRICEVNSFYGGGKPGVSDTFGSAF